MSQTHSFSTQQAQAQYNFRPVTWGDQQPQVQPQVQPQIRQAQTYNFRPVIWGDQQPQVRQEQKFPPVYVDQQDRQEQKFPLVLKDQPPVGQTQARRPSTRTTTGRSKKGVQSIKSPSVSKQESASVSEPINAEMKVIGVIKEIKQKGDNVLLTVKGELQVVSFPSVEWLHINKEHIKKDYARKPPSRLIKPPSSLLPWIQFFLSTFGIHSIPLILKFFGHLVTNTISVYIIPATVTLILNGPRYWEIFQTQGISTAATVIGIEVAIQMTGILVGEYFSPDFMKFGGPGSGFANTAKRIFITNLATGVSNKVKGTVLGKFDIETLVPAKNVALKERELQFGVKAWISQYTTVATALVVGLLCGSLAYMNLASSDLESVLLQIYDKALVVILLKWVGEWGLRGGLNFIKQKFFKIFQKTVDICKKWLQEWLNLSKVSRKYYALLPQIIINILSSNIVKTLGPILNEVLTTTIIQLAYEHPRNMFLNAFEFEVEEIIPQDPSKEPTYRDGA